MNGLKIRPGAISSVCFIRITKYLNNIILKLQGELYMNIADNILKYHLKNVYFICGTACGGKTTISRALAEKYGFVLYDMDTRYPENDLIADNVNQPAMTTKFPSWEYYFNRPYKEYGEWLKNSMNEQIPMALIELIKLSQNQKVVADIHLSVDTASRISDFNRVVFLIARPELISKDYYKRPDHRDLYDCIMSLSDPEKSFENCSKTLEYCNGSIYNEAKNSELF
jgi:hypothetical protein